MILQEPFYSEYEQLTFFCFNIFLLNVEKPFLKHLTHLEIPTESIIIIILCTVDPVTKTSTILIMFFGGLLSLRVFIIFYTYTLEVFLPTFHIVRWICSLSPKYSKLISNLLMFSLFLLAILSLLLSMQLSQFFKSLCRFSTIISKFTDVLLFVTHNYYLLYHSFCT